MRQGISLIEIIVAIGVFLTLVGMASISFVPYRGKAALDTSATTLISDIRSQQIKAMVGDTEGRSLNDNYGVHFGSDSYTLFHGSGFNPSDSSNFTINLDDKLQIESTFPSSQVLFSVKNGEILSFTQGQNSITVRDTVTGVVKTININRYGVTTSL